jgi:hypothetical protein
MGDSIKTTHSSVYDQLLYGPVRVYKVSFSTDKSGPVKLIKASVSRDTEVTWTRNSYTRTLGTI